MSLYRKNPVVIEARQFTGEIENALELIKWVMSSFDSNPVWDVEREQFIIETPEGDMTASLGDYIIKDIQGEFYPCKPGIFEATYERVES